MVRYRVWRFRLSMHESDCVEGQCNDNQSYILVPLCTSQRKWPMNRNEIIMATGLVNAFLELAQSVAILLCSSL